MAKQVRTESYIDPLQPWRVEVNPQAVALVSGDISKRLTEENGVPTTFFLKGRFFADERLSNLIEMRSISQCYHRDQQPRRTLEERFRGFLIDHGFVVRRAHV